MNAGLWGAGAAILAASALASALGQAIDPRPPIADRAPGRLRDVLEPAPVGTVRMSGFLGARVAANESQRLSQVDLEPLLAGYRVKPGTHPWIGEHIGKWMHAATLAWAHSGDTALKTKLDGAVRDLIAAQEPDGYLGTYVPEQRFGLFPNADWDVWSHKYCLIGLLTYHRYTDSPEALASSRRAADLLVRTFGPGKKSILSAGTHVGMAATSVLEPMTLLYRATGEAAYLEFARYLVSSWDEPNGPRVLSTLAAEGDVSRTANSKAYEMLSNLVGLCELARTTGDGRYLEPVQKAWMAVVRDQLYITGTASWGEHFHEPHRLPHGMSSNIGETCVTVTWMQLNEQLLRLTGEAKYADELERSLYNHLAGAQRPDGREWCYYTALEGRKEYGPGISCCVSSGPRGVAMAPELVFARVPAVKGDSLAVMLFEPSSAEIVLGGVPVRVEMATDSPTTGGATLTFRMDRPARFGVLVRRPAWAEVRIAEAEMNDRGWLDVLPREWKDGDTARLNFEIHARVIAGEHGNTGLAAAAWGPFVLAYDQERNGGRPLAACERLGSQLAGGARQTSAGLEMAVPLFAGPDGTSRESVFVPFADAGAGGGPFRVWLRDSRNTVPCTLVMGGVESRNYTGNVSGSIIDGDPATFVVTWDMKRHDTEWFAVTLASPAAFRRVVYTHGQTFHDGGWFDASNGPPRVEVRRTPDGKWETLGVLADYPKTTGADAAGLKPGMAFSLTLTEPVTACAVRVIGTGGHGDNPAISFASCAELALEP